MPFPPLTYAAEHFVPALKSGLKEWGLRALVQCPSSIGKNIASEVSFVSVNFAKMITINHNTLRPQDAAAFNLVQFRRAVRAFVDAINNPTVSSMSNCPRGFRVVGWFKPSKLENETFVEVHEYHVISIEPNVNPLPNAVMALRFPKPVSLDETANEQSTPISNPIPNKSG